MKTVLITGASGFVGQNFISDFRVSDYNILSPSSTDLDLLNREAVLSYLESKKPDTIINAAGKVGGILRNIKDQYSFLLENTTININLISAAKEKKIKNFINLSSSCIYPNNFVEPIKESDLLTDKLEQTNEGYALAKIIGLKMTDYISNNTDYNYKTIIPCNLFGPNDNFDINFGHMIPAVMNKIHLAKTNNDKMVTIWGDGNSRREFMYIKDLIDFIYYSIENIQKLPNYINVGVGSDHTIREYYKMISKVIGYKGNFKLDLSKPQGMKRKLVDISLLNNLGWKHKYPVEEGLQETYKFYEQNYE